MAAVPIYFAVDGCAYDRQATLQPVPDMLTLVPGDVSSSLKPPGFESDLIVRADVSVLYRVWAGFVDYDAAVRHGEILLEGPPALVRAFPRWFMWSPLVDVARQYREHRRVSA